MSFTRADDLLGAWRLESTILRSSTTASVATSSDPSPEGYLCYNPPGVVADDARSLARPPGPGR